MLDILFEIYRPFWKTKFDFFFNWNCFQLFVIKNLDLIPDLPKSLVLDTDSVNTDTKHSLA